MIVYVIVIFLIKDFDIFVVYCEKVGVVLVKYKVEFLVVFKEVQIIEGDIMVLDVMVILIFFDCNYVLGWINDLEFVSIYVLC